MFNRIKIVNAIIFILCLQGGIQLLSGGLSLRGLFADKENFQSSLNVSNRLKSITDAWTGLNLTRIALNRGMLRLQMNENIRSNTDSLSDVVKEGRKQLARGRNDFLLFNSQPVSPGTDMKSLDALKRDYLAYADVLDKALTLTEQRKLDDILQLHIQTYQVSMQESYNRWRVTYENVSHRGISENQKTFTEMLWTMGGIIFLVILMILLSWAGLRRMLIAPLRDNLQHLSAISEGDLTRSVKAEGNNEMAQLANGILQMQQSLIRTVSDVRTGADSIYTGASEIASGSHDLSSRTEQQAASLEETAASMEQLTATVKLNADNSRQASQLAVAASDKASRGGDVVSQVVSTMDDIASSSEEIAAIINVIDGIAFQTNILALNAAVEAARAGEQGRGFAVVAGEVRNLAQRSALAAKDIKILIETSVNRIESGSALVKRAGESMSDIVGAVTRVTDIMAEIAAASDEQSRGIEQVGIAVHEMDNVTQQNASLVEESVAAAAGLEEQAGLLQQSVSVFRLRDDNLNVPA